jgi:hypothetical protein
MKTALTLMLAMTILGITGCEREKDYIVVDNIVYVYDEDDPPPVPQGVYSITGDREVLLYWLPVDDVNGDFASYVVYRSDHHPDTGYVEIGRTTSEYFVDRTVTNGHTYYYAVSSVDIDGNLSDLSYEYVFDTPRPQGANRTVFDYNRFPDYAGWNLAGAQVVNYQSIYCDFYLEYFAGDDVFYLNVNDTATYLQDMGYTKSLDEIDYSPEYGWSQNGWCEVILGHTYVFWTGDNHFAKIRVTAVNSNQIYFDWAYQVDPGNPELKPRLANGPEYLRHPQEITSITSLDGNGNRQ